MTRRDVWLNPPRPCVAKWRQFKDRVRELGITVQDGDALTFWIPMPPSWSKKKREKMLGSPHQQTPDLDNLIGGLFDAALPTGDAHIHELGRTCKRWWDAGRITIERNSSQTP